VTVLAIAGDREQLVAPDPHRPLEEHDRLVLAGSSEGLRQARTAEPGSPKAPQGLQVP
jgi:K+/H+ antiporter YhaU regulatory subunit KhtT